MTTELSLTAADPREFPIDSIPDLAADDPIGTADDVLSWHKAFVETKCVTGTEIALRDRVIARLRREPNVTVYAIGGSLVAITGDGGPDAPTIAFNTHLDTVPPSGAWTGDPWTMRYVPEGTDGDERCIGLGANDAKASGAAMTAAFLRLAARRLTGMRAVLMLVRSEETSNIGSQEVTEWMAATGMRIDAALVGEPTALQPAIAQKGLLIVEVHAEGDAAHAAHGTTIGARNAIRRLAGDLARIDALDRGPVHAYLGPATLEPTMMNGGTASNVIPAAAMLNLDIRTTPDRDHAEWIALLRETVRESEVRVRSERFLPYAMPDDGSGDRLLAAATAAYPNAKPFGSRTMSDLIFFRDIPAIKVGPGRTERSHRPDEYATKHELLAGTAFYERIALAFGHGPDAVADVAPIPPFAEDLG